MRDFRLYLIDISESIEKITSYTEGMSEADFISDPKTFDAVVRNLEIIGEAAGKIPDEIRDKYPEADWRAAVGMRNIIAHEYFGVRPAIIWKTLHNNLPGLRDIVLRIIEEIKE